MPNVNSTNEPRIPHHPREASPATSHVEECSPWVCMEFQETIASPFTRGGKEKVRSQNRSNEWAVPFRKMCYKRLNCPWLVMSWGSCKSRKMSQEYGPRGILLLLELGPITSPAISGASAADAAFGRSTGNWFCTVRCTVHPSSLQETWEWRRGKGQARLCCSGKEGTLPV